MYFSRFASKSKLSMDCNALRFRFNNLVETIHRGRKLTETFSLSKFFVTLAVFNTKNIPPAKLTGFMLTYFCIYRHRYNWQIDFLSPGGDYPTISATSESLSSAPGPVSITSEVRSNGGLVMTPIYGDFLRTAHTVPQVT